MKANSLQPEEREEIGTLTLRFGALAPSIKEQVSQRFKLNRAALAAMRQYDRDARAIARLSIRGLLASSQTTTARRRLIKRVSQTISAHRLREVDRA